MKDNAECRLSHTHTVRDAESGLESGSQYSVAAPAVLLPARPGWAWQPVVAVVVVVVALYKAVKYLSVIYGKRYYLLVLSCMLKVLHMPRRNRTKTPSEPQNLSLQRRQVVVVVEMYLLDTRSEHTSQPAVSQLVVVSSPRSSSSNFHTLTSNNSSHIFIYFEWLVLRLSLWPDVA